MPVTTFTPYSGVASMLGTLPSWMDAADGQRHEAYTKYEQMYWNAPDTYKLVQRGTDTKPLYIPSARVIIEATNRFLAKGWDYVIDPRIGSPADQQLLRTQMNTLFKRETVWTKFATQKRYGLIRGDALWHIVADPAKPAGARLSIYEIDPGSYFPIYLDNDPDRLIGMHIVDQMEYQTKVVTRRLTYRKDPDTGVITTETSLFEIANWDDRDAANEIKKVAQLVPPTPLPPTITAFPVYHIKNSPTPGAPFGSSELRGLETIMAAVNQTISDQELAIAMDGIGLYATNSGPPVDDDGNETNWLLGPGRVVEIDENSEFKRVAGVTNLPGIEHIDFILGKAQQSVGIPDIAIGNVDVQVAESGVALAIQLAPLLAKNAEKEQDMLGVYDHMLWDITHMWLPAYEAFSAGMTLDIASVVTDPMPVNRQARIAEILQLLTAQVISGNYARELLTDLGYNFPAEMGADIVQETQALAEARGYDPFMNRVNEELDSNV